MNINESLRANDLRHLVKQVFEIDAYKSKIGDDEGIIVLSFTVDREQAAKDLENFVELGYSFVIDADVSPGETDEGVYKVFVELERDRHAPQHILTLLDGVERLTGIPDMRFRYFKNFKSFDATLENLTKKIPTDKEAYKDATRKYKEDNYDSFFSNSNADVSMNEDYVTFEKQWADPISFEVIESGPTKEVYNSISGPIMMESKDIAQILFYTKYIGNYNINKVGQTFIFENNGWAVALRKV